MTNIDARADIALAAMTEILAQRRAGHEPTLDSVVAALAAEGHNPSSWRPSWAKLLGRAEEPEEIEPEEPAALAERAPPAPREPKQEHEDEPGNPTSPEDTLWTVKDVAAYLAVSRSWIYQRTAAGTFPHLNVGGLLRFDPAEVKAWARGQQAPGAKVLAIGKSHS